MSLEPLEPLNFAIIGAGNIGKIQAEAIQHIPSAWVTVVCNRGEAAGRALAAKVGSPGLPILPTLSAVMMLLL